MRRRLLLLLLLLAASRAGAAGRAKLGAYYFGMWSSSDAALGYLDSAERLYGRRDVWAGVKDFYGREPGVKKDTRGWKGDFSRLKPAIGYYDYAVDGPAVLAEHIRQATRAGLSYFSFYWYWDAPTKGEAHAAGLRSFLAAPNRERMEFMLSVCAHPWDPRLRISAADGPPAAARLVSYFSQPNYLKTDGGRPILFILDGRGIKDGKPQDIADFIALVKKTSREKLGVDPFVLTNLEGPMRQASNADGYSCLAVGVGAGAGPGAQSYAQYAKAAIGAMDSARDKPLLPCFAANFDERPRQDLMIRDRAAVRYFKDYSDAGLRAGLVEVRALMDRQRTDVGRMLTLYAWNEWHEGGILEPNARDGDARLKVVSQVFFPRGFLP